MREAPPLGRHYAFTRPQQRLTREHVLRAYAFVPRSRAVVELYSPDAVKSALPAFNKTRDRHAFVTCVNSTPAEARTNPCESLSPSTPAEVSCMV